MVLLASASKARASWGLVFCPAAATLLALGEVPPTSGCAWHMAHASPLKVGPSPEPSKSSGRKVPDTESFSAKTSFASSKITFSLSLKPA
jgi:hypothetical protein